ncbi:MAG: ABC-F type ribosomal protection protein [Oscillospiraceae bacterium]|jgi:lincosamide and streptogramin A transport system ATP-binding/permease protein|nr:ABC-F type ribosomal protection protein [Oscillospiraceae bacterium]
MSAIQVSGLTFSYDGSSQTVFDDVSFRFDTTWRLGLIGRNGRGKTTLLRLLAGQYAYRGQILSPVRFDCFPPDVGDRRRPARDVAARFVPPDEAWRLSRELSLLALDEAALDRPFDTLSPGEQTKLLLAALFLREGHFPLIDEPTNHLDLHARALVGRYLRQKEGFVLVSHDRAFLDACVDHILALNRTGFEVQDGNFSTWQQNRARQDAFERAENDRLKKEMKRLTEASRRTAGWADRVEASKIGSHAADRGHIGRQSAKMMKRAKATQHRREAAAAEKAQLLRDLESSAPLALHPLTHHAPRLLESDALCIRYGDSVVCQNVRFTLRPGRRLAVIGGNGSGKSSLLKLIMGEDIPHTGQLTRASGLRLSYVPQDTSSLRGNLRAYAWDGGLDETLFLTLLRKLDFARAQFDEEMQHYSEGQKKKVLLARSLCEQAHLYVWDEPLNYVDVISRLQLEELLLTYAPTMLFVEHDRRFVDAVATDVLTL